MLGIILGVIVGLAFCGLIVTFVLGIRNDLLYNYRIGLSDRLHKHNKDKINEVYSRIGNPYYAGEIESRLQELSTKNSASWDALDQLSYDEMLWKFWKPFDSFITPELDAVINWEWDNKEWTATSPSYLNRIF